jgi:hypothetical protein
MLGLALIIGLLFFSPRHISLSVDVPNECALIVGLLPLAYLSLQIDRGMNGLMAFLRLCVCKQLAVGRPRNSYVFP